MYSKILNVLEDERDDTITIAFGEGPLNEIPDIVFRGFSHEHHVAYEMINGLLKDKDYQICEDGAALLFYLSEFISRLPRLLFLILPPS